MSDVILNVRGSSAIACPSCPFAPDTITPDAITPTQVSTATSASPARRLMSDRPEAV